MSRILMTGFTSFQCNVLRKRNPLYSGASALYYALTNRGHTVVNSKPPIENVDALREFDAILCGLYSLGAIVSGSAEMSLLLVSQAQDHGIPVTFYLDDWHLGPFSGTEKSLRRHFLFLNKKNPSAELVLKNIPTIAKTLDELRFGGFAGNKAKVLIPWFNWVTNDGPEKKIKWPKGVLHRYDPTNLFPVVPTNEISLFAKRKSWVLSSRYDFTKVTNQMTKDGSVWPITRFGCRKTKDFLVKNELDLLNAAYAPNWGVISHPYPAPLQGQWRNRFMFAFWAGCVVYAQGLERVSAPYMYSLVEMENMTSLQLRTLHLEQSRAYFANCQPKSEVEDYIEKLVLGH